MEGENATGLYERFMFNLITTVRVLLISVILFLLISVLIKNIIIVLRNMLHTIWSEDRSEQPARLIDKKTRDEELLELLKQLMQRQKELANLLKEQRKIAEEGYDSQMGDL